MPGGKEKIKPQEFQRNSALLDNIEGHNNLEPIEAADRRSVPSLKHYPGNAAGLHPGILPGQSNEAVILAMKGDKAPQDLAPKKGNPPQIVKAQENQNAPQIIKAQENQNVPQIIAPQNPPQAEELKGAAIPLEAVIESIKENVNTRKAMLEKELKGNDLRRVIDEEVSKETVRQNKGFSADEIRKITILIRQSFDVELQEDIDWMLASSAEESKKAVPKAAAGKQKEIPAPAYPLGPIWTRDVVENDMITELDSGRMKSKSDKKSDNYRIRNNDFSIERLNRIDEEGEKSEENLRGNIRNNIGNENIINTDIKIADIENAQDEEKELYPENTRYRFPAVTKKRSKQFPLRTAAEFLSGFTGRTVGGLFSMGVSPLTFLFYSSWTDTKLHNAGKKMQEKRDPDLIPGWNGAKYEKTT